MHGGRFNRKGIEALYTSRRLETAWLEAQQSFPFKAQPMTLCTYQVDCEAVVDLTSPIERARLDVTEAEMACPWEDIFAKGGEPPSWAMSRRLIGDGIAGAIVPSYASGAAASDVNVVFWRWSDSLPHQVMVVDDFERLPKDDASWR